MQLDVKQAVEAARQSFLSLLGDAAQEGMALEEVELVDDEKAWLITLGYNPPLDELGGRGGALSQMLSPQDRRKYKLFKINRDTGEVQSMKIRTVPHD